VQLKKYNEEWSYDGRNRLLLKKYYLLDCPLKRFIGAFYRYIFIQQLDLSGNEQLHETFGIYC